MFSAHKIGSNSISAKNLVLLFFTIMLGFASVITLAQSNIDIPSNINNAWQTIKRVTITNDGTDNGTTLFDFNMSNGKTYINTTGGSVAQAPGSFAGKVLGVDDQGNLIYAYTNNLVLSGGTTGGIIVVPGGDSYWTGIGSDIYNTNAGNVGIGTIPAANNRLHIKGSGDTDIYIEETAAGNAASLRLQTPQETWIIGGDSSPNVFFVGILGHQEYFTINPLGNVGIGTINPQEKLEINGGNIRISNLSNAVVLGTNASGTIIASTSGSVYNFISGFILSGVVGSQGNTGAQGATGPAGTGIGDNLGNHIATGNLNMAGFGVRKIGAGAGLLQSCSPTEAGTVKFSDNCFQGCDGVKWVELGGTCTGLPAVCGNGTVQQGEQCDDGNTNNNDGCSSSCQRETQIANCGSVPVNTIPNTVTQITQICATSNGSACTSWLPSNLIPSYNTVASTTACQYACAPGYTWDGNDTCIVNLACGNGIVQGTEQCDDGNTNDGDGCSSLCVREKPLCSFTFTPTTGGAPLLVTFKGTEQSRARYDLLFNDTTNNSYGLISFSGQQHTYQTVGNWVPQLVARNVNSGSVQNTCYATGGTTGIIVNPSCGNGAPEAGEQCDDGNSSDGDGCSSSCQREKKNEACLSLPANAVPNTATEIIQTCQVSNGTSCITWSPLNVYAYNTTASTSLCNYICAPGYTLSGGVCSLDLACGNGEVQGTEQCDDGNISNGDGCSSLCTRETPICSFTMDPTSGVLPLDVTFNGVEQERARYSLNFGDFSALNNVEYFSGRTHTYVTAGKFEPVLTVTNSRNIGSTTNCYATGSTTRISINKLCGRGSSLRGSSVCTRGK